MRTEEGCKELKGTGGGNRQWPRVAGRKPRDPEDRILRKIHMGNLNTDTDHATMHSYFEKFGAVEQCYRIPEKETYENHGYGFVVFQTAATADEVQKNRPHIIMGRAVSTRRAVPWEWKDHPGARMRSKKVYIARVHGPQDGQKEDITDADLEEYYSRHGDINGVFQEKETDGGKKKGSVYIEFSDEDPVDRAVLVGVHNVKKAVIEVERGLSGGQQEEVRSKQEQQKKTGTQGKETPENHPPTEQRPAVRGEQETHE